MKFAIKCSYVETASMGGVSVAKDPITDKGKRNKPGRLKLVRDSKGNFRTLSSVLNPNEFESARDQLVTIFENGRLLREYSLDTIRNTCEIDLDLLDSMQTM